MGHFLFRNYRFSAFALFTLLIPLSLPAAPYDSADAPDQNSELKILRVTPNGIDVPASRQLVFQFDRNVVPVGRMERSAEQIPITVTPQLNCEWRWLNTSALACQLGRDDTMKQATRYNITVAPGISTESGLGMKLQRYTFTTQRPKVRHYRFFNWLSPVTPLIQVTFNQPVTHASVSESLSLRSAHISNPRLGAIVVYPDELARELPRFLLPLEGPGEQPKVDDRLTMVNGDEARRVWLVKPRYSLPADAHIELKVAPGLISSEGSERGVEDRTVVRFDTFPDFSFLGVKCQYFDGQRQRSTLITLEEMTRLSRVENNDKLSTTRCQPLQWASLAFSSPVPNSQVRDHVTIQPPLDGGRDDYNPWENIHDRTYLSMPHRMGQQYTVRIPESLKAYQRYDLLFDLTKLQDEFGRKLSDNPESSFFTAHRRPDFTVTTPIAVLEKGVESEVALYVTNLDSIDINYDRVDAKQGEKNLSSSIHPPEVEDVSYSIPMGVRELIGSESGAIAGTLHPEPEPRRYWRDPKFFIQVTPFQVHAKLGHFSSEVWVTDMSSGEPVADASVSLYKESYVNVTGHLNQRAAGSTNTDGLLALPGIEELDPELRTVGRWPNHKAERYFLRVQKGEDIALLPLDNSFLVRNADSWPSLKRRHGHAHAWGTTAQGVYKLGDTVEFKIYLREQSNKQWVSPIKEEYKLKVLDPTGKVVHEREKITLSEFGALDGSFKLAESGAVGWYQFKLSGSYTKYTWKPLKVLVSDFTPSPFKVRAELNGDNFQAGDEVELSAAATMHSGGPFTEAEARLTARLKTSPFSSSNPRAKEFSFGTGATSERTINLLNRSDTLDSAGLINHTLTLPEKNYYYGNILLEAAVKDERGKFVAATARAKFKGRDRYVGLKKRDWLFKKGEQGVIEALVVDAEDKLTAGTPIEITIERREFKASRVKGPGNAYLTRNIVEWVTAGNCNLTSVEAPVACPFTPEKAGSYRFTAKIKDSKERQHSSMIHGWATGKGYVAWEQSNDSRLQIIAAQNEYKIGDTARYMVQNPYPGSKALISVERYGVLDSWVQSFDSSTPLIEFPVKADYLPGFYLSVLIVSPRVDKPLGFGNVDLGKPAYRMGYLKAEVSDPFKQLDISVTPERENYKPRETVKVKLHVGSARITDTGPVEIAVAVVDESVLALNSQGRGYYDPYRGFNRLDGLDLNNYSLLTRLVGRQKFEKKGANSGGDGGGAPAAAIRNLFKYVSYWNPVITPDAQGNAEIEFTVPDNLTGWRILTWAVSRDDLMGLGDGNIKVNRETEIRPVMPNQVIEGDSFKAGFNVMNRSAQARSLKVKVAFDGPLKKGSAQQQTQQLELAPYKRGNIWVPIETHGNGELKFTISAGDKLDADGLEHTVPVNKRRSLETAATYGTTERNRVAESILIPEQIYTDVGGLSVVLSPSVIGNIDGAFDYMKKYPHYCWEQRLTKAVMASSYIELEEYMEGGFKWDSAKSEVLRQLESAANFQAPNGGMAYWKPENKRVSPYLSAYTAMGFNWLRRDGYAIPQAVEQELHDYLLKLVRRDTFPSFYSKGMSSSVRAVALAALAEHGKVSKGDVLRYQSQMPLMDLFGRSHYLQAVIRVGGLDALEREAVDSILGHASQSGGKFAFNEAWDDSYRYLLATPLRSNCTILSSLVAAQNHSDESGKLIRDIPFKLVRSITQTRGNRDHWENTQENVFCMNALVDYSKLYEAADPDYKVAVSFDNKAIGETEFKQKSAPSVELKRPMQDDDAGRHADVVIEKQGPGRLYYSARLAYDLKEDNRSRINAGIEVRREYSVERDGKWQLLESPMALKRGEVVRVDLYISLPTARHFVAVNDPIPGGLEPINADLATSSVIDAEKGAFQAAGGSWYFQQSDWSYYGASLWSFYHKELRHDSARFYADYLSAGNYHLSYTAQAIAEGDFSVMPLHVEEMYDPDVYGMGLPARLVVGQ